MTAFTSTQSGNWNDPATWGGGGYPSSAADTAAISAQHDVTIPSGVTITCGAISFAAGVVSNETKLIIDGTLEMGGTLTTAGYSWLYIGPGGTLDLNGFNVVCGGGYTYYKFKGTALNRATVTSTGTAGAFTNTANILIADIDYCDVSGLGDSVFGRTHSTASLAHSYLHSTFTGCGLLDFEAVGTGAGTGIRVAYCDFRNPSSATPYTSSKWYPNIYQSGTLGANERVIEYCTWETNGAAVNAISLRVANGMVARGNIFRNVKINVWSFIPTFIGNFFDISLASAAVQFFENSMAPGNFTDNYFYYRWGDHPLGSQSFVNINVIGNIFEGSGTPGDGKATNWLLYGGVLSGATINVKNNIFLGEGNAVTFTGNSVPTLLDISNNTFYIDNDGTVGSGIAFAPILITEQASTALGGTVEIYNNIVLDPDTSTPRDDAVGLLANTADQIDYLDYNVGWGYPAGSFSPPVSYGANTVVTAGVGVNDASVDPKFVDRSRKLAAWDASNEGAGTADNAVVELLKLNTGSFNSAYSVAAAVEYVKAGFTPTAKALQGAGRAAMDIGAMVVVASRIAAGLGVRIGVGI